MSREAARGGVRTPSEFSMGSTALSTRNCSQASKAFSNWSKGAGVQARYASSDACSLYAPGQPW